MNKIELLEELIRRVPPRASAQKKAEESIAKAVNAVLPGLTLTEAHRMTSAGVKALSLHLDSMTQADLKKLLKAWDPNRKVSQQQTISDLRVIADDLLNAVELPLPKQPTTPRRRRAP